MNFIGWMYDIAREQSPDEDSLHKLVWRSAEAGYGTIGLYLEHRFAYPSVPWAAAPGCLTPEVVRRLHETAREAGVRLVPFLNTLGHMEGFIRSEGGQWLAEGKRDGVLQICPSREECVQFAVNLVDDAMEAFDDEWVHLGGDETYQLGECPVCAERAESIGKEGLYAEFYGRLCRHVVDRGRRPCLWGDMLIKYPAAMDSLPTETVIFDWHYEGTSPVTVPLFKNKGFDVVCCPAIRSYDAGWCFLDDTRRVIDDHGEVARGSGAEGVCICAWEFFGFSSFASVVPLIMAAGRRLALGDEWKDAIEQEGGADYFQAAEILGSRIPALSPFLAPGTWRSIPERLARRTDPFALWRDWRRETRGEDLDELLEACEEALRLLKENSPLRFPVELHKAAVMWVRLVSQASAFYAGGRTKLCIGKLKAGHGVLAELRPQIKKIAEEGGSSADPERLERLLRGIVRACSRIESVDGNEWRPAFETITQDTFVPGDQAAWRTEGPFRKERS